MCWPYIVLKYYHYFSSPTLVILDIKINVLAVDDHTLFRKGTVMMLESFDEVREIHEADNGQVALEILNKEPIDLILLDLEMPVMDGWETARRVMKNHPKIHVIMVSMHDSLQVISDLIEMQNISSSGSLKTFYFSSKAFHYYWHPWRHTVGLFAHIVATLTF